MTARLRTWVCAETKSNPGCATTSCAIGWPDDDTHAHIHLRLDGVVRDPDKRSIAGRARAQFQRTPARSMHGIFLNRSAARLTISSRANDFMTRFLDVPTCLMPA